MNVQLNMFRHVPKKRIKKNKKAGGLVFFSTLITFQSFFVIFP